MKKATIITGLPSSYFIFSFLSLLLSNITMISAASASIQQDISCINKNKILYNTAVNYAKTLQKKIDEASKNGLPAVYLEPGLFSIDSQNPILLKKGVSLIGDQDRPTIITVSNISNTGIIQITSDNTGWSIQNIVFENVNILTENQKQNEDDIALLGNVFLHNHNNTGRAFIESKNGHQLYIDGNVFLSNATTAKYNIHNTGILFDAQENSVISNNIFGMDLQRTDDLISYVPAQLLRPLRNIKFIHQCLKNRLTNEQGYLDSGIELYNTRDVTIRSNLMNATLSGQSQLSQDHVVKILGGNQTFILQNFIAGWKSFDVTSAVDFYFISNYLANIALQLFISTSTYTDFLQLSDITILDNFFYKFLEPSNDTNADWLYQGVSFYDFYTARFENTIETPIYNKIVPISPFGWDVAISKNKFASIQNMDPNIISLGNLDLEEASVDSKNCYVTTPLIPGSEHEEIVQVLSRQKFEDSVYTRNGGRVPMRNFEYNDRDLIYRVPAQFRDLIIPDYWRVININGYSMIDPVTPCYTSN